MPEVAAELNPAWPARHAHGPGTPAALDSNPKRANFDLGHAYDPHRRAHQGSARGPRRAYSKRALIGLAAVALVTAAAIAAQRAGALDRDRIATLLGFGIEQVSLTGHSFTADADLFEALDLKSARSLASIDAPAIRKRFERLPWVQSVEIARVWPDQLAIRVTERKPFAVWEKGDGAELIDVTGRRLGAVRADAQLELPRVAGEGANETAAQLMTALGRHPALKAKVVRARRLGERRWTLDLAGGGQIHLPTDGEVSALARLANEPQLIARLETPGVIIDLRSQSKIAIRTPAVASGNGG